MLTISEPTGVNAPVMRAIAEDEALISRAGIPSKHLFVLGPPTRGRYTEIVAIPDIRIQAADIANQLVAQLREPSGLATGPAA